MIRRLATTRGQVDEHGFAMVTVVGTMLVLTLFVIAAATFAVNALPSSRRSQDYAAAMAAAQVGIDDVLSRLNQCDAYWSTPCSGSPAETARWDGNPTGSQANIWAAVPGAAESRNARYRYALVATPANGEPFIRVRADGEVNGVRRTVTADLQKDSFLKYIYYTDYEAISPELYKSIYGGTEDDARKVCGRYYYSVPPSTAGVRSPDCDINFVGGDVIRGKLHTNDALLLSPRGGIAGPNFTDEVTTNWKMGFSPSPADPSKPYRQSASGGIPIGNVPVITDKQVSMPASNAKLKDDAAAGGCVFEGPTRVELNSAGQMRVTSPLSTTLKPGCVKGTWSNLPPNGVLYVQNSTKAPGSYCTTDSYSRGKPTGVYPLRDADATSYSCTEGDIFLEGTLKGQLTVAAQSDIIVTDDVKYNTSIYDPATNAINQAGTDVLGLVADGSVRTYHPVNSSGQELDAALTEQVRDLEIDAAIMSVNNSFTVQNYRSGTTSGLGKLKVRGGIYQRFRGPVGTSGGTGYLKDYVYDSRLITLPPPHFVEPVGSAWNVVGLSE